MFGNYAFFRLNRYILHWGCNMFTKFGESWSNSKEMATVFFNSMTIWRRMLLLDRCATFRYDICVLHRIRNIPSKFCEGWKNSYELTTVFQNSIHLFFDMTDAIYIGLATLPLNLVRIGHMVKKWQQFFRN